MGAGYLFLACSVAFVAVLINLAIKFDAQAWIGRGLQRGDLYSLVDVASGLRPNGLTRGQAERLIARGMVRSHGGNFRATLKGRVALLVRNIVRRRRRNFA